MGCRIALVLSLSLAAGCTSEQAWEFENGFGLSDEAPARIVAQVHEGGDCGFACNPPGASVYCASIASGMRGVAPELEGGRRYCFSGVAYDASGHSIGVGCAVATVGGGPISVTLSPSDEDRQPTCGPAIDAGSGVDAGPGAARDGGRLDAGPSDGGPGSDAGIVSPVDAGPPPPQNPVFTVVTHGHGGFIVQNVRTSWTFTVENSTPRRFPVPITVSAGNTYTVTPQPQDGYKFGAFTGGGCEGMTMECTVTIRADTQVDLTFAVL